MQHPSFNYITLPQRLNSFLSGSSQLRQLSGKVRQLRVFQLHYEKICPPSLLRSSHVAQFENNVLILSASNSAVAAKLRQLAPELLGQIQLNASEVTGIQVRVQVTSPPFLPVAHPSTLSSEGRQKLCDLAATLPESPLKSALQRLASGSKNKP